MVLSFFTIQIIEEHMTIFLLESMICYLNFGIFEENKIDKIEEFAVALKDFKKLEKLELYLNKN